MSKLFPNIRAIGNREPNKLLQFCVLLLALMLASGCVTTTTSKPRAVTADKEEAFNRHIQLAMQYINSDNRNLANVHLDKAAEFDANAAELFFGYAFLYQKEGEDELARQFYEKTFNARADYSSARYTYGAYLFNLGDYEGSRKQLEIVSRDLGYNRRAEAFYIQGLANQRLNDAVAATALFERTLQLAPRYAPAWLQLAALNFEANNLPRAKQMLSSYQQLASPTAASLWLSIQIEQKFGNRDAVSSDGLKLKNMFPYSRENLLYQEWIKRPK